MGFGYAPQQHIDVGRYFQFRAGELWLEQPLATFSFPLLGRGMFAMSVFLFRSNEILCQKKKFPQVFCTVTFLLSLEKNGFKVTFAKLEETL